MIVIIGAFGQLSGNGLITYFLPVLLRTAGITSQGKRLTLTFVNTLMSFFCAIAVRASLNSPALLTDRMQGLGTSGQSGPSENSSDGRGSPHIMLDHGCRVAQ
jgi:hypothetical protein